jgi:hypothetical protein
MTPSTPNPSGTVTSHIAIPGNSAPDQKNARLVIASAALAK